MRYILTGIILAVSLLDIFRVIDVPTYMDAILFFTMTAIVATTFRARRRGEG